MHPDESSDLIPILRQILVLVKIFTSKSVLLHLSGWLGHYRWLKPLYGRSQPD